MNLQKTALFAVILFGLLLYIRYVEMPHEEYETKKVYVFKDISKSEFKQISVTSKNGNYTLVNSDPKKTPADTVEELDGQGNPLKENDLTKSWRLSDLPEAKLDTGRVNSILSALSQFKSDSEIPAPEVEKDLGVYGLSAPEVTAEVSYKDQNQKILFGKTNDYAGKRYVKLENKPELYLVSPGLFEALDKKKGDLRDATPIEIKDGDIESITIKMKEKDIVLTKKDFNSWVISSPLDATASLEAVNTLIQNLRNLRSEDFVDTGKVEEFGLNAPQVTVVIKGKDKEVTISLAKKKDESYFSISNDKTIYKASGEPLTGIVASVDNYREKKLLAFDIESVNGIAIEKDGTKIVAGKNEKGWKTNDKEGDEIFINQYLKDISDIQALSFVSDKTKLDTATPLLKISLSMKDKGAVITVLSKSKEGYLVVANEGKDKFYISEDSFKKLNVKEESLVKT